MQNSEQSYKLSHLGTQPQPSFLLLVLIFQGRYIYIYFSFFPCISPSGLQLPALFLSDALLRSPCWPRPRLRSPLPYVYIHYLARRGVKSAIKECLSIQPDGPGRVIFFLPISFASFGRLNNVCVSGAASRLDAGPCGWESSVCQVCH